MSERKIYACTVLVLGMTIGMKIVHVMEYTDFESLFAILIILSVCLYLIFFQIDDDKTTTP